MTTFAPDTNHWLWPILEDHAGTIWFSNWSGVYSYNGKSFTNYTVKLGKDRPDVTCICEDTNGTIWAGSDDGGIARFDGKSFQAVKIPDEMKSLGVACIVNGTAGDLWIGTRKLGLYRYDGSNLVKYSE